jgi:hypothetical protein
VFCHKSAKIHTLATAREGTREGTRMAKMLDGTRACHAGSETGDPFEYRAPDAQLSQLSHHKR